MSVNPQNPKYVPFTSQEATERGSGFRYGNSEYIHHSNVGRNESAFSNLNDRQYIIFSIIIICIVGALLINWMQALIGLLFVLAFLYTIDLFFNMSLISRSLSMNPAIDISEYELDQLHDSDLPIYTILCPLYKESAVLPQFVDAVTKIDYDKDRLQVLLLLEDDDNETIAAARAMNLPDYFTIVVVPHSLPKTKPKACNYGLLIASGKYVVIFDAEDIPDPDQLKKAVLAFEKSDDSIVCLQSELAFYNPNQNLLTKAFTAEYSLWFNLTLTGLQSIEAPIPLGGTSNHFKTDILRQVGGWDAFNVTEDADLGIRLVKKGYRTSILKSRTMEEANSNLKNWFWQRSRWIKGYMQTYLVHTRSLNGFQNQTIKKPHSLTFQLIIGGKVISMLVNPIMWLLTITYIVFHGALGSSINEFFPAPVLYLSVISLIFGNFLYLYYYMIGCIQNNNYGLVKYAFLVPFYWLAMSSAAYYALYELFVKPHHWHKTKHGLHLPESIESTI